MARRVCSSNYKCISSSSSTCSTYNSKFLSGLPSSSSGSSLSALSLYFSSSSSSSSSASASRRSAGNHHSYGPHLLFLRRPYHSIIHPMSTTLSSSSSSSSASTSTSTDALFSSLRSSQALNQGIEQSRYATLATLSKQGHAACRTIVIRSLLGNEAIVACTDLRSQKISELRQHANTAELCWWFPSTKEQYRILSRVSIVDHSKKEDEDQTLSQLRHTTWSSLSPSARAQFNLAAPGTILATLKHQHDLDKYEAQPPDVHQTSDNFALLVLYPQRVDYVFLVKPSVSPHPIPLEVVAKESGQEVEERHAVSQGRWILERESSTSSWNLTEVQP